MICVIGYRLKFETSNLNLSYNSLSRILLTLMQPRTEISSLALSDWRFQNEKTSFWFGLKIDWLISKNLKLILSFNFDYFLNTFNLIKKSFFPTTPILGYNFEVYSLPSTGYGLSLGFYYSLSKNLIAFLNTNSLYEINFIRVVKSEIFPHSVRN